MRLRKLCMKDTCLMLEWMHDEDVTKHLATKFTEKKLSDCENFVQSSLEDKANLHLAIVSDEDEYMGTVSLKCIDNEKRCAEFGITIRKSAMGRGYSWFGMCEILGIAFNELCLQSVYWCVSLKNERACRFYDKHGFHEAFDIPEDILHRYRGIKDLKWYSVLAGDDYQNEKIRKGEVNGCKIVSIKTIPTVDAGQLSFFESNNDIPFEIKRIYYISKVPEGVRRGFHAHKNLKQLLFCPYGRIQLILDDGTNREEITLSDPSIGVLIEKAIWREMLWVEKNSVLCVAASDYYDTEDYIREYQEFLAHIML